MKYKVLEITSALKSGGIENILYNYFKEKELFDKFEIVFASHEENGDIGTRLESLGYKTYFIPPKSKSFILYFKTLWNLIDNTYSIVHVHQSYWSIFPLFIAALRGVRIRIVQTHSAFFKESLLNKILHKILGFLSIKVATHLWACGEKAGIDLYGNKRSFYIMKNAINVSKFDKDLNVSKKIKEDLKIGDNSIVLCQIGRFFFPKNQSFTIDVLYELKTKGFDFVCIFLGDGKDREFVEDSIKEKDLSKYVRLMGNVKNVRDYLNCVDISLLPSFYEGLPVSVLETQAMGIQTYISDRITDEICITNLVKQISIDDVEAWVNEIMKYRKAEKNLYEYKKMIIENGYDINLQRQELRDNFLNMLDIKTV